MRRDGFLDGGELASKLVRCRELVEEEGDGEDMLAVAMYLDAGRSWVAYTLLTCQMRFWVVSNYLLSSNDGIARSKVTPSM